jgi:hypothetical protein
MLYLALITHDFPKKLTWTMLFIEITIFSILNTIPHSLIAYNRKLDVGKATGVSLIFYIVVYLVLQSGGFFTYIFSEEYEHSSEINSDIPSDISSESSEYSHKRKHTRIKDIFNMD